MPEESQFYQNEIFKTLALFETEVKKDAKVNREVRKTGLSGFDAIECITWLRNIPAFSKWPADKTVKTTNIVSWIVEQMRSIKYDVSSLADYIREKINKIKMIDYITEEKEDELELEDNPFFLEVFGFVENMLENCRIEIYNNLREKYDKLSDSEIEFMTDYYNMRNDTDRKEELRTHATELAKFYKTDNFEFILKKSRDVVEKIASSIALRKESEIFVREVILDHRNEYLTGKKATRQAIRKDTDIDSDTEEDIEAKETKPEKKIKANPKTKETTDKSTNSKNLSEENIKIINALWKLIIEANALGKLKDVKFIDDKATIISNSIDHPIADTKLFYKFILREIDRTVSEEEFSSFMNEEKDNRMCYLKWFVAVHQKKEFANDIEKLLPIFTRAHGDPLFQKMIINRLDKYLKVSEATEKIKIYKTLIIILFKLSNDHFDKSVTELLAKFVSAHFKLPPLPSSTSVPDPLMAIRIRICQRSFLEEDMASLFLFLTSKSISDGVKLVVLNFVEKLMQKRNSPNYNKFQRHAKVGAIRILDMINENNDSFSIKFYEKFFKLTDEYFANRLDKYGEAFIKRLITILKTKHIK